MLFCGALERSNNPYIESIVEPCVSKDQKEILATSVWLGRKSQKRAESKEKSIHGLKAEFVYLTLGEKKINGYEITVIIFNVFKKCKSPRSIQKEF